MNSISFQVKTCWLGEDYAPNQVLEYIEQIKSDPNSKYLNQEAIKLCINKYKRKLDRVIRKYNLNIGQILPRPSLDIKKRLDALIIGISDEIELKAARH